MEPIATVTVGGAAGAGVGVAAASGGLLGLQALAAAALPTIMSSTGVVVAGVGTLHGPLTAVVASFAATSLIVPVSVVGATVGTLGYIGYRAYKPACNFVFALF
jgi:hypothetical protein